VPLDKDKAFEWLGGIAYGDCTRMEDAGIDADWCYSSNDFLSAVNYLVSEAAYDLLPAATVLWIVCDSAGMIEGALITRDFGSHRYASMFLEQKELTTDREARGLAAAIAVLEAVHEVADRLGKVAVA
jgi:hypothetical protein